MIVAVTGKGIYKYNKNNNKWIRQAKVKTITRDNKSIEVLDEILDNDVRNIMEEKISNTEKLTNKNTKNIKILLITLYCIILSVLIFVIIYYSTKKDFTNKYQNVWICSLEEDIGTDTYYLYWTGMEDGSFSAIVDYSAANTVYDENIPKGVYGDIVLDDFNFGSDFYDMIIFLEHRKNNLIYRGATCR